MTTATTKATLRRLYIDGKWCDADNGRTLFELQDEPHKTISLADKPEQAVWVRVLTALLEKEPKQLGDYAPLTGANPTSGEWMPPKKSKAEAK